MTNKIEQFLSEKFGEVGAVKEQLYKLNLRTPKSQFET